jgi:hypothetical protein
MVLIFLSVLQSPSIVLLDLITEVQILKFLLAVFSNLPLLPPCYVQTFSSALYSEATPVCIIPAV